MNLSDLMEMIDTSLSHTDLGDDEVWFSREAREKMRECIKDYKRLKHIIGERLIDIDKCHMPVEDALDEIRKALQSTDV